MGISPAVEGLAEHPAGQTHRGEFGVMPWPKNTSRFNPAIAELRQEVHRGTATTGSQNILGFGLGLWGFWFGFFVCHFCLCLFGFV